MSDDENNWMSATRQLVGALVVVAITWHVFWEVIHPILVGISPMFAYDPDGRVGRYPDSPAQVALFATALLGIFIYYLLEVMIFEGVDELVDTLIALYTTIIIIPAAIIKNDILPLFGIDRWEHDPYEDDP